MKRQLVRVGLVVPSSNTTMETEIPAILNTVAQASAAHVFTFHSARMRMKHVRREELAAMNVDAGRAVRELSDAPIDVVGFACLVAIMAMENGYHRTFEAEMRQISAAEKATFPIVTSAGALVNEIKSAGARRVAMLMPYNDQLSRLVADYIEHEGITVQDYKNFSVTDNAEVSRIPSERLVSALDNLSWRGADLIVASACVQMPALGVIEAVEKLTGLPTTSASVCTAKSLLRAAGIPARATGFGSFFTSETLAGKVAVSAGA